MPHNMAKLFSQSLIISFPNISLFKVAVQLPLLSSTGSAHTDHTHTSTFSLIPSSRFLGIPPSPKLFHMLCREIYFFFKFLCQALSTHTLICPTKTQQPCSIHTVFSLKAGSVKKKSEAHTDILLVVIPVIPLVRDSYLTRCNYDLAYTNSTKSVTLQSKFSLLRTCHA